MAMQTRPLPLTAFEIVGNFERNRSVYLHLITRPDGSEEPVRLGTGRSAVVFLATDIPNLDQGVEYRAVKFLRDDPDDQSAYSAAIRFFQEALSLQNKSDNIDSLVSFLGWGAIARDLKRRGPVNSVKEFWWGEYFDHVTSVSFEQNNGAEYQRIKDRFALQGPFYCLELCHGTFEHLLEHNEPWFELPLYRYNEGSANALRTNAQEIHADLVQFAQRYLRSSERDAPPTLQELARMSGYDLLNAFRTAPVVIKDHQEQPLHDGAHVVTHDPDVIRNHAVLKIFNQIVQSIQHLHQQNEAHRDLKPGNIFFRHNNDNPLKVDVQLADLGSVTNADVSQGGETLKSGNEHAPGSPFYRAPEQAELPIEVRVSIDPTDPTRVYGKGSKISNIQPSDWLYVADLFEHETSYHSSLDTSKHDTDAEAAQHALDRRNHYLDQRFYRIHEATLAERSGTFVLQLERPIRSNEQHDLQAQISKGTGFHTDIYSLGAILYDLASGGRNPEHFYTYCLKVFTDQFGVNPELIPGSINEVMELLIADKSRQRRELKHRFRLARLIMTSNDVDGLIEEILRSAYLDVSEEELRKKLRDYRFRTFDVVNSLLTDKRGQPIPAEIVAIIVRCMLRDKEGSFCRSDHGWTTLRSSQRAIVNEIGDEVNRVLSSTFRLPDKHFPERLQDDLLFRLRSLAFDPEAELDDAGLRASMTPPPGLRGMIPQAASTNGHQSAVIERDTTKVDNNAAGTYTEDTSTCTVLHEE